MKTKLLRQLRFEVESIKKISRHEGHASNQNSHTQTQRRNMNRLIIWVPQTKKTYPTRKLSRGRTNDDNKAKGHTL
ncbi:hypothetical protein Bhyg_07902 [Pseudolycoriella hygida]|uniref:Uncharacterized protein n=1 Tax=Pseudolycoriella hygida TaxID=35572 RepID=A0A9Q0N3W2_9DIPT|nr:hypothetical protein Bhyg_07902 [Pseudolycoriella hygida]